MTSSIELKRIVGEQLARIGDIRLREMVAEALMEPVLREVPWDYGEDGKTLACWILVDLRPNRPSVLAYCDRGFGPLYPFGIIDAELSSMGMDAQWFLTMEDALRCCRFGGAFPPDEVG